MAYSVDEAALLDLEITLEYLAFLGTSPLAARHTTGTLAWVLTGIDDNTYNGVLQTQLAAEDADDAIGATLSYFRAGATPALWYVTPGSRPADLGERLRRQGCFELDPGMGMAADLERLPPPAPVAGLTIRRVADADDLARWCAVYEGEPLRRQLYASLGLRDNVPLRHFVGLLDETPVATSSIFLGQRAAALLHVEVRPNARRRGIGTAIVLAALHEARTAGYRTAVVAPSAEGQPLYARLGFFTYRCPYTYFAI